jgi:hypothetical protein
VGHRTPPHPAAGQSAVQRRAGTASSTRPAFAAPLACLPNGTDLLGEVCVDKGVATQIAGGTFNTVLVVGITISMGLYT